MASVTLLMLSCVSLLALEKQGEMPADVVALLEKQNVTWDVPGPTSRESMPIGNGDIGLNVWVEENGDLVFYIGKTDSWSEDIRGSRGLLKLGEVRVSLNPGQLSQGAAFRQILKLYDGEILVKEGANDEGAELRVWVDANNPVIRVEVKSKQPVNVQASLRNWRTQPTGLISADVIVPAKNNRVTWYHRNSEKGDPQTVNLTSGAVISGANMVSKDEQTLTTSLPTTSQLISIYPLTRTTATAEEWQSTLDQQIAAIDQLKLEESRQAHQSWWHQFWGRSWIFVEGDADADKVTQGYILQRFVTACGGRGAYPIKFNGSIFTVDYPSLPDGKDKEGNPKIKSVTADYRDWGGQYWFQNTRAMYWPRLMAGDFDMMLPLFKMYHGQLAGNSAITKGYYGHDGTYFAETAPFWGGMKRWDKDTPEDWTGHYFCPILELSMMMLDYYDYTGDRLFAKELLLPVASAGLQFYSEHFDRDANGKILLDPCNSIEMYWKVRNPAPDIAGLHSVLARMLALPEDLTGKEQRQAWLKMQGELPSLPVGVRNGKKLLLPYEGEQTAKRRNGENPELYAVYPYRVYGVSKPDLALAVQTFKGRSCKQKGCWVQDPVQAAMLGLTDVAKEYVIFDLTRKEPRLKFPAFWEKGCDYMPDEDNGGNGENGLQQMLMYADGKKMTLLPAWPAEWKVRFKLNAPYQTTVEGRAEKGKLTDLQVTPPERKSDVTDWSQLREVETPFVLPANIKTGSVKSILMPDDPVMALKCTKAGQANILATSDDLRGEPKTVIDGNINSKQLNVGQDADGFNPRGVNTGLLVMPRAGHPSVTAIQFATGNDMPGRDPLKITVEGSDDPEVMRDGGTGFVLLYQGGTGLEKFLDRKQWGPVVTFENTRSFRIYRVLITETRSDSTDGTQYSEMRLGSYVPGTENK